MYPLIVSPAGALECPLIRIFLSPNVIAGWSGLKTCPALPPTRLRPGLTVRRCGGWQVALYLGNTDDLNSGIGLRGSPIRENANACMLVSSTDICRGRGTWIRAAPRLRAEIVESSPDQTYAQALTDARRLAVSRGARVIIVCP